MSRVLLRASARRDIDNHADYIGERRRSAGRRFYSAAQQAIKKLAENPVIGSLCEWENSDLAHHVFVTLPFVRLVPELD